MQAKSVKKLRSGSRATFISPYLRRPLRPLDKVLSEQGDHDEVEAAGALRNEAAGDVPPATLGLARKPTGIQD